MSTSRKYINDIKNEFPSLGYDEYLSSSSSSLAGSPINMSPLTQAMTTSRPSSSLSPFDPEAANLARKNVADLKTPPDYRHPMINNCYMQLNNASQNCCGDIAVSVPTIGQKSFVGSLAPW